MTEQKVSQSKLVESVFVVGHTHEAQAYSTGPEGGLTFEDKGSFSFSFFFFSFFFFLFPFRSKVQKNMLDFQADSDLHPLDRRFSSKLLFNYPKDASHMAQSLQSVGMVGLWPILKNSFEKAKNADLRVFPCHSSVSQME